MQSDFPAALLFLERAFVALRGDDEFSLRAREALALLIGACLRKQAHGPHPDVPAAHRTDAETSNVERFQPPPCSTHKSDGEV